jgi:hypothetical protein
VRLKGNQSAPLGFLSLGSAVGRGGAAMEVGVEAVVSHETVRIGTTWLGHGGEGVAEAGGVRCGRLGRRHREERSGGRRQLGFGRRETRKRV